MISIPQRILICGADDGGQPEKGRSTQEQVSVDRIYILFGGAPNDSDKPAGYGTSPDDRITHRPLENGEFDTFLHAIIDIIEDEAAKGNHVLVNLDSPQPFASAAFTACMIQQGPNIYPFYGKHMIQEHLHLPIQKPTEKEVRCLRIWIDTLYTKKKVDLGTKVTENDMILALAERGIDDFSRVTERMIKNHKVNKNPVMHAEKMNYRRNYRERWENLGWIAKEDPNDKIFKLTKRGKFIALAYHRRTDEGMGLMMEKIAFLEEHDLLVKTAE